MSLTQYVVAFLVSLITVGVKGFQHRNMAGRHVKWVFVTAWLIAIGDVAVIGLVVKGGWNMVVPLGLGASLGMVGSIWVHDRLVLRKERHDNTTANAVVPGRLGTTRTED